MEERKLISFVVRIFWQGWGGSWLSNQVDLSSVLAYTNRIEGKKAKFNKFENILSKEKLDSNGFICFLLCSKHILIFWGKYKSNKFEII